MAKGDRGDENHQLHIGCLACQSAELCEGVWSRRRPCQFIVACHEIVVRKRKGNKPPLLGQRRGIKEPLVWARNLDGIFDGGGHGSRA